MREEIIKMATEVWGTPNWSEIQVNRLERFFRMAQTAERIKICAQLRQLHDVLALTSYPPTIKTKGQDVQEQDPA